MQTLQNILQILRDHKPQLQIKYPIAAIGVFGSYAKGIAIQNSDVDIIVELTAPMGLNFVAMADEIEALLGIKTGVIPAHAIKAEFLIKIEKHIIYV